MNNKKIFFTYIKDEEGKVKLNRVIAISDSGMTDEDFDIDVHGELFSDFLKNNNISGNTLVTELEEKGIFDESALTQEKIDKYVGTMAVSHEQVVETPSTPVVAVVDGDDSNTSSESTESEEKNDEEKSVSRYDDPDQFVEDDEKDSSVGKRVLAGTLLAITVAGLGVGLHSCSHEQVAEQGKDQTLEDLLNQMTPEQRAFFESSFKAAEEFNNKTTKEDNFKLDKDTSDLHITVDETVALNIILNNYSADDLYEVFGTLEFDSTNIINLGRSAYSKLSTYYMNATESSGISQMINDEAARKFFEKHEKAVIEFNNNPSIELSDNVIKVLYYDYLVDGAPGNYASIENYGVAWLSTSAGFGFELANRNVEEFLRINHVSDEEIAKYKDAAASVGLSLNQVTTSELLASINEEVNIDIMDEVDNKSLCASVAMQTREKISALTFKQQIASTIIETNAKDELIEGLRESGNISLSNKVLNSEITPELLNEIRTYSANANNLVDEYNSRMSSLSNKEAKIAALLDIAKEKYNNKSDIELANLVNNRFRSPYVIQKEPVVDTTPGVTTEDEKKEQLKEDLYVGEDKQGTPVYDGDKLNELAPNEREQFIKDNGESVSKSEKVTEEVVDEKDLTEEEQKIVANTEETLEKYDRIIADLTVRGTQDANKFTETKGAYNYSGEIVIDLTGQKINVENETLAKIAQYSVAYEDKEITSDDEQIQNRMEKDNNEAEKMIASFINSLSDEEKEILKEKHGSKWDNLIGTYNNAYIGSIESTLKAAKEQGKILAKETEAMYQQALEELQNAQEKVEETVTPLQPSTPVIPPYDENTDENYSMPGEELVSLPETDKPLYYVSDEAVSAAVDEAISEETIGKAK